MIIQVQNNLYIILLRLKGKFQKQSPQINLILQSLAPFHAQSFTLKTPY